MPTKARSRELLSKFLFTVNDMSGGFGNLSKFQKASGLECTIAWTEYAEGGAIAPIKEPGRVTFGNVTLARGVSEDEHFYDWCKECIDMLAHMPEGKGRLTLDLLRDLVVWQNDRTQKARIKWPMYSCGPAKWSPSDWDNMSDDIQIESLEMALWFFDRETQ
jgi:phage tail-like protein